MQSLDFRAQLVRIRWPCHSVEMETERNDKRASKDRRFGEKTVMDIKRTDEVSYLILVFECRFLSSGTASWPLRTRCWHPAPRAAARMLLASLLTPWTDVLLLLRCWHSPLGSLLAVSLPSAGCWHPAARTAAAGLAAGTLLLALAVGQPACCIVAFGWLVAPCYSHGRRWTRCWHPAPRALLMMPAIRGPCVLKAAPLFW